MPILIAASALCFLAALLVVRDALNDRNATTIRVAREQHAAAEHIPELSGAIDALTAAAGALQAASAQALLPGPSLVGRTVVVHTRRPDDQSIRGVLAAHHADRLVLQDAIYMQVGAPGAAADGLVNVPMASVSTMQEIAAPTGTS